MSPLNKIVVITCSNYCSVYTHTDFTIRTKLLYEQEHKFAITKPEVLVFWEPLDNSINALANLDY